MFSGIVEKLGKIEALDLKDKWGHIEVRIEEDWDPPVEESESIATQGVCLTVAKREGMVLHYDVLRETFERTNLGEKQVGSYLNLERSLKYGQTMGGHIVIGHVDGTGRVAAIDAVGRDWKVEITAPPELMDGMVFKGSVSIDGISLTIAELKETSFVVHIIPFTWEHTTFGTMNVGDAVNLEVDLLGKFVRRLVERGQFPQQIDWDDLRREGLIKEDAPSVPGE